MVRRVAVIGAGAGGLASIKCCLDEGLEPTCFERSEDIGGIWRYTDSMDDGRVSVYHSVITNTSKEMSCFSDFPCPEDFPSFLPHGLLLEYFRMYARHFNLLQHIRFKTTALSVRKRPDFATSGQWEVVTETDGVQELHVFDAVMVCTGHYQKPYLPLASFPGIETRFKGRYLHSQEYKDMEAFRGKRVLVIGIGNTGGDLAVELSHVAAKVFLSARTSTWVFSRISDHGFPFDMVNTTRFNHFLDWLLPSALMKRIRFRKFNSWFNHANYGLASTKSSNFKIIINEELPFCLLSGTIVLKPSVREFTESSAVFEDGTTEENIDVVIFATGYIFSFPFLEESVRSLFDDNRSLYKCIFLPQLEKQTLAIIGLVQLTGSVMVGTEMQARWVTGIFSGWNKLPPTSRMMADVLKKKPPVKNEAAKCSCVSFMDDRLGDTKATALWSSLWQNAGPAGPLHQVSKPCPYPLARHHGGLVSSRLRVPSRGFSLPNPDSGERWGQGQTPSINSTGARNSSERENLKISFISYTDEIASCAGVKPNLLQLLLTDPRLALVVFFGPCTPYQYRLVGRGKWSGARDAILTQWQRTLKPLRTRVVDDSSGSSDGWRWLCLLALPVALSAGFLLSKYPQLGWSLRAGPQL